MVTSPYSNWEYVSLLVMTTTAVGLGFVAVRSPRHRSAAILGLGALMGAGYFIAIHGARVVDPQQIGWLHGDALDHFLGWHLFRHEPWQMPPGLIRTLVHPIGTSIGNTDSIPLFALMFKPFDAVLPADFQYIGLWLLCAFTLQGIFGVLLVRTMTASTLLQLIGSALLFLSPTMLYRLGHPALVSQWLLLASLWLYCRREHSGSTSMKFAPWGILLAVAAATHPYLCAMVFALACAAGARWALETPGHVMPTFIALLMLVIDVACVWWLLGYFVVRPGDMQSVGLEEFSMNLLSFVMPMTASAVLPEIPLARAGQYEGFNYLGLGVIVLLAVAAGILLRRPPSRATVIPLLPLVVVVLLCTCYAMSNEVTAGARIVLELPQQLWAPFAAFRATGRFGWPGHYLVVFLAIAVVVRRFGRTAATACLCGALVLQLFDLLPPQLAQRAYRRRPESYSVVPSPSSDSAFWRVVVPRYTHLMLWPPNICGAAFAATDQVEPLVHLAGRHRLTINDGSAARYDHVAIGQYCERLENDMATGTVSGDTVYIMQTDYRRALFEVGREPLVCFVGHQFDMCVTLASMKRWPSDYRSGDLTLAVDQRAGTAPQPSSGSLDQTGTRLATMTGLSVEELIRLQDRLDQFYRERLQRSARNTALTDRLAAVTLHAYLGYRLAGCTHRGATNRVLLALEGIASPDCPAKPSPGTLPPRNETLEFMRELEQVRRAQGEPETTTYVDLEGEAVWTQTYVDFRLQGCTPHDAFDAVLATIQGGPIPDCR